MKAVYVFLFLFFSFSSVTNSFAQATTDTLTALDTLPESPKPIADSSLIKSFPPAPPRRWDNLKDRDLLYSPPVVENSMAEGTVIISLCVDQDGNIISAQFQPEGSTTDDTKLIAAALKNAKEWKFSKGPLEKQCGIITYKFKLR